jgi:hypothetical protein
MMKTKTYLAEYIATTIKGLLKESDFTPTSRMDLTDRGPNVFDHLIGKRLPFYGAQNNMFKLGSTVFEAVEDQNDGHRSMMKDLRIVSREVTGFFHKPVAIVMVQKIETSLFEGYELRDEAGHVWLKLGTTDHDGDGHYPVFTFEYEPKRTQTSFIK